MILRKAAFLSFLLALPCAGAGAGQSSSRIGPVDWSSIGQLSERSGGSPAAAPPVGAVREAASPEPGKLPPSNPRALELMRRAESMARHGDPSYRTFLASRMFYAAIDACADFRVAFQIARSAESVGLEDAARKAYRKGAALAESWVRP
ncbi:MAG: hypothetical protein HY554_14130 [Elusimicrobia bacterium]|nr:hypothetical protein [Elusimicrobiota bacterium]